MRVAQPQPAQPPRVLIVVDQADIGSLMTFVLERSGDEVIRVTAVAEAQAAISLSTVDAALLASIASRPLASTSRSA